MVDALAKKMRGRRSRVFQFTPAASYTDDDHWNIFTELNGIIAMLDQREKDASWE